MIGPFLLPLGVLTLVAGCDLPLPAGHGGPQVVSITPDPSGGDIDRSTVFRIELDRRIAPGSVVQGAVSITSGDEYVWADLAVEVVRPAILVTPWYPLDPDVEYELTVHALRDLDGHTSTDSEPVVFHTSRASTPGTPDPVTYADSPDNEVRQVFDHCAGCHAGEHPPLGMDLSTGAMIRATALDVAARQVRPSVGGYLDVDISASIVGLPRIDPHNPARSYLLYALLGDPHIAGASMPLDQAPLPVEQIELLQRWIQAGAPGL